MNTIFFKKIWTFCSNIAWCALFMAPFASEAQRDSLQLEILAPENAPKLRYQRHFSNKPLLYKELAQQLQRLQGRGYIEASIDTVFWAGSDTAKARLWLGNLYQWEYLGTDSLPNELLSATGYRRQTLSGRQFRYTDWQKMSGKLLDYSENNGYPFAQLKINDLHISDDYKISGDLRLDQGQFYQWGDITVHAPEGKKRTRIQRSYLRSYLSLLPKRPYDESRAERMERRLKELPFLRSYQRPFIVFQDGKAHVHLFLENQRASRFDILVGLLPNDNPATQKTKVDFTGLVDIDLLNSFGLGERLQLRWQQMRTGITEVEFQFQYPYIAKLPLGADFRFKLYKRDTTYLDIIFDVGARYLFGGNNYLKAYWNSTTTNLIYVDTQKILSTQKLPSFLDTRLSTFGIEYFWQALDYRFNPRRGFELKANAGFSLKRIRPNLAITELVSPTDSTFSFAALYDSISTRSFLYRFSVDYSHFFPLWRWSSLMARARLGWLGSPSTLLPSELFRLGGNRFLRGFDEESVFANWYNVATLEWRFIFGTNSYAYLFGEVGYLERNDSGSRVSNIPYSFGVGVVLGTKIGLFGLSYAMGSQQGNPLIVKNAKIHFGYVGMF